jgi:hypothetical protein
MKKDLCFFAVILLLLTVVSACKKKVETLPEEEATFQCKINGKYWETKTVSREVLIRSQESPDVYFKTLIISGTSTEEELLTVHIYNMYEAETGDCPGVYTYYGAEHEDYETLANTVVVDGIRFGDHSVIAYFSPVGSVSGSGFNDIETTITACENYTVSGTFKGTVYAQDGSGTVLLTITEGVFEEVPYVIEE